jgi:uroporphyrinogen-III synthase
MPTDFRDATVVFFQGREIDQTAALVERLGGRPISAPAISEVAVEDTGPIRQLDEALAAGRVDELVLLSGIGCRMLLEQLSADAQAAMKSVRIVSRGPKTGDALRAAGLEPTVQVDAPYTTTKLLEALGAESLKGKFVAVQQTGRPNDPL